MKRCLAHCPQVAGVPVWEAYRGAVFCCTVCCGVLRGKPV